MVASLVHFAVAVAVDLALAVTVHARGFHRRWSLLCGLQVGGLRHRVAVVLVLMLMLMLQLQLMSPSFVVLSLR